MRNPPNAKERGLLKGAIRRVFSRSELRKAVVDAATIKHFDSARPRVTKWVFCAECGVIFPKYLAQVDHIVPLIPLDKTLEDLEWTEVVDRAWCDIKNLACLDPDCHKIKSKIEAGLRRQYRGRNKK